MVVIALLLSVGAQSGIAAPLRLTKEIRATSCCKGSCSRLRDVACNGDCCGPNRGPDTSIASPATRQDRAVTVSVAVGVGVVLDDVLEDVGTRISSAPGPLEPAPIFLRTRALRL